MGLRIDRAWPLLLAAYPPLWIASTSTGRFFWSDLALILVVSLAATALLLCTLGVVIRRRGFDLAALAAGAVVVWFWGVGKLADAAAGVVGDAGAAAAIGIGALLTVGAVVALAARPAALRTTTRAAFILGALLVVQAAAALAYNQARASRTVAASRLAREFAAPVPMRAGGPSDRTPRDIYLIILDTYARRDVLHDVLGHDNGPFEDSLRALGFTIPAWTRSNYQETIVSLPSIFNLGHVDTFLADGANEDDDTLPLYLMQHNRAGRFARARGYRYLFFPSPWWRGTQTNAEADEVFRGWRGWHPGSLLARTELRRVIWRQTALRWLVPGNAAGDPAHIFATFDGLADVASRPELTFTVAHFLVPHLPYVLDGDCRRIDTAWALAADERERAAYVAQLTCVNTLLLELVHELLRRSEVTPVVLLQGDHGTAFLNPRDRPPITRAQLIERSGAFGAYLLPGGGDRLMSDSVSAVNVLRHVFHHYLGADLDPLPNDFYYADRLRAFDFTRYTTADLAP